MVNSTYANARAVSAENALLGSDRLGRMAECPTKADAMKVLAEVNFGEGAVGGGYEDLIFAEEKKFIEFVKETSPDENFKRYLIIGNDYHNAEVFSRAKFLKFENANMLVPDGLYKADYLKDCVFADDYGSLTPVLAEALLAADNLFVLGNADGKGVSGIFRRALYKELYRLSRKNGDLKKLFSVRADAVNVSLALRMRRYDEAEFVVGGSLDGEVLKLLASDGPEAALDKLNGSPLKAMIESAVESAKLGKPLSEFERLADGYALKKLKETKYDVEGFKPFTLYCFYKKAELANVRIILSCIDNGIDKAEIKRRVRETYEG